MFKFLIPTLSLALLSASVFANDAPPSRHDGKAREPLVLAEAREKILAQALALDANNDGVITAEERAAAHENRHGGRMGKRHGGKHANEDGSISVEEFVTRRYERLAALDTDDDGTVSVDEFRQAKGHHRGHRRGPPPADAASAQ